MVSGIFIVGGTAGDNETDGTNDTEETMEAADEVAEEEEEDTCLICREKLPAVRRGVIKCVGAAWASRLCYGLSIVAGYDGGGFRHFVSCLGYWPVFQQCRLFMVVVCWLLLWSGFCSHCLLACWRWSVLNCRKILPR